MNNKDLSIMIDDVKLNVRVGAIISYKNKVLVEKNKNVDFMVVPGGRIKTLEDSKLALVRELDEELGIKFEQNSMKLVSLIENFFEFDNNKYHELYFVYRIDLEDDNGICDGMVNLDNGDSNYYLLDRSEFESGKVLPEVLKDIAYDDTFKHYVVNELV